MTVADSQRLRAEAVTAGWRTRRARTAAPVGSAGRPDERWQRQYRRRLVVGDTVVVVGSLLVALASRIGLGTSNLQMSYLAVAGVLAPLWLLFLVGARAYDRRCVGSGADEFKRVVSASLRLLGAVAVTSYLAHLPISRTYVLVGFPLGVLLLLVDRYAQRRWLGSRRRRGEFQHRVLAVGTPDAVRELAGELAREPYAGLALVGVCLATPLTEPDIAGVPVFGSLTDVAAAVVTAHIDTVAITSGPGMSPQVVRQLSWELHPLGVDLVVAPALTNVAGPRISIRPVAGLPLLHVDEPTLSGPRQWVKSGLEWSLATVCSLLLLPVLGLLAAAIRLDSPGAPLFRQTRVGRDGREFTVFKLRTMHVDAESLLDSLREHNECDGVLFKMCHDPRVTRVGRWLRAWSLDELPQLWNVVRGDMALVGPRPPLPAEVSRYGTDVARRLLVRPGMTGLWQVSGRSTLSWEESVRLDLYYVENWSLALDAMILWKTAYTVIGRQGAY